MRTFTKLAIAVGAGVLVVGGGTATVLAAQQDDGPTRTADSRSTEVTGAGAGSGSTVSLAEAVRTAQGEVPHGVAVEADLDHDNGAAHWEIDLVTGDTARTVYVGADDGKVLRTGRDTLDRDDRAAAAAHVDLLTAVRTAQRAAPDAGAATEADADFDGGRLVWEVSFGAHDDEQEVTVDARTGHAGSPTTDD
jgi:uncharacterized membrane protein YkoI